MNILENLCLIVLPVLVTALLTSVVYRKFKERQAFDEAARVFREAFAEEIALVKYRRKGDVPDADQILEDAFQKHLRAVNEFRNFLSKKDVSAFNEAWDEYHKDEDGEETWYQYAEECTGLHDKYPRDPHFAAAERIETLLKFAKPK